MQIKGYRFIVLLFITITTSNNGFSQPFSNVDIGLTKSSLSLKTNSYSNRWNLSSANSIQVRTPFYVGVVGIGIDLFDYNSKDEDISDISSINFSAYIGLNLLDSKYFELHSGLFIGIQELESSGAGFQSNSVEKELFYAFGIEPQLKYKNLILFSEVQYRRVYNFYRQDIIFAGVGLKIRLTLSEKMRGLID